VKKDLAAAVLDDEPETLVRAKPLDPAMQFAGILEARGATLAQRWDLDAATLLGNLALLLNREDELPAAFLASDLGISIGCGHSSFHHS
jgi:hypothetical protein